MLIYLSIIETEEEKSKFEKIYLAYRQLMFYIANNILKDEYLAEDAVHEAFIKILKYLDKIDEIETTKTKGLVIVITESVATDLYRERKRKSSVLFEDMELSIPKLKTNTLEENLAIAITLLPERYKTIVLLKYRHGYSNQEIAMQLDLSENNVRNKLENSKKKLSQILRKIEGQSL